MPEPAPAASGADLARMALAAARANAKHTPAKKTRRVSRAVRGEGRDPQGLGAVLGKLKAEQGWDAGLNGGNILDQWQDLCPQYTGLVDPAHYDESTGRLDLRPSSHAYAAQLRILGGQLAKQINDKLGRTVVRTIRVLPVGAISALTADLAPGQPAPAADAPVKTRDTAHPGYRTTLEAALAHKPDRQPTNPYVTEAIARQEAALRASRPDETEHREAVWEIDRLETARVDQTEAVRQAAIARARHERAGGTTPRRAFDVA